MLFPAEIVSICTQPSINSLFLTFSPWHMDLLTHRLAGLPALDEIGSHTAQAGLKALIPYILSAGIIGQAGTEPLVLLPRSPGCQVSRCVGFFLFLLLTNFLKIFFSLK